MQLKLLAQSVVMGLGQYRRLRDQAFERTFSALSDG